MRMIRSFLVLLFAILVGAGCDASVKFRNFEKDRANAIARVEDFRRFFAGQDYEGIYNIGSPSMKAAVARETFVAAAKASTAQFGKLKSTQLVEASCPLGEVRLVYHTVFEKGEAEEWFIWALPNESAQLVMYKITPGFSNFRKESEVGCPT